MMEVDVLEVGVKGAKSFFEAQALKQTYSNYYDREIRAEQEERRRQEDLKKEQREKFMAKMSIFNQ